MKKVIFGLGNYGPLFDKTRHNAGFFIVDKIISFFDQQVKSDKKWELSLKKFEDKKEVIFVKLKGMINNSGQNIKVFLEKFNLKIKDAIIIYDDVNLEVGKIRFRRKGSSGGHNGIRNIIEIFESEIFCRLKVGIGNEKKEKQDLKQWVLSNFTNSEVQKIEKKTDEIIKIVKLWINE